MQLPSPQSLLETQQRLHGRVLATPLLSNSSLDAEAGAQLWLKAENMQRIGAFKARGALNTVDQLTDEQRIRGLVTYSSGNHGQAVAWVAQQYRIPATVYMPDDAPSVKVMAARALDATVIHAGTTSDERRSAAIRHCENLGGTIVEPFDHPHAIVGQGTAFLEMRQQLQMLTGNESLDQLFVPVGGGGLIAGACLAFSDLPTEIISVEPIGCDSLRLSIAKGSIVSVDPAKTLADGLRPVQVGAYNFEICRRRVNACMTVSDEEIGRAMIRLLVNAKCLVEPSGAAALAGALRSARQGARVGVLLSGGNVSPKTLAMLLQRFGPQI